MFPFSLCACVLRGASVAVLVGCMVTLDDEDWRSPASASTSSKLRAVLSRRTKLEQLLQRGVPQRPAARTGRVAGAAAGLQTFPIAAWAGNSNPQQQQQQRPAATITAVQEAALSGNELLPYGRAATLLAASSGRQATAQTPEPPRSRCQRRLDAIKADVLRDLRDSGDDKLLDLQLTLTAAPNEDDWQPSPPGAGGGGGAVLCAPWHKQEPAFFQQLLLLPVQSVRACRLIGSCSPQQHARVSRAIKMLLQSAAHHCHAGVANTSAAPSSIHPPSERRRVARPSRTMC